MFVCIADRIRGIRRIELSSDNFRQQHKAGKKALSCFVFIAFWPVTNAPSLPEIETVGIRVESRKGRKKMALFRGILLFQEEEGEKKKKKMRVEGRGFDLPPVATRPDRLQRGTVTLARRSQVLTYLLRRKPRKSYTRSLAAVLCS